MAAVGVTRKRRGVTALAVAALLTAACASTPKLNFESWEIKERVESQIRTGMSRGEVRGILGEPTLRRSNVSGGAEWEPLSERRLYSECWYWGQDATVCFGQDQGYGVVYKHAASDSVPR